MFIPQILTHLSFRQRNEMEIVEGDVVRNIPYVAVSVDVRLHADIRLTSDCIHQQSANLPLTDEELRLESVLFLCRSDLRSVRDVYGRQIPRHSPVSLQHRCRHQTASERRRSPVVRLWLNDDEARVTRYR